MPRFPLRVTGLWGEKGLALEQHGSECGPFGGGAPKGQGAELGAGSHACHSRNRTPARRVRLHSWADRAEPERSCRSRPSFFLLVPISPASHTPPPHRPESGTVSGGCYLLRILFPVSLTF